MNSVINSEVEVKYEFIMLIDDDPLQNMLHEKILSTSGLTKKITSFSTPQKALEFLECASYSDLPDVIFLDIMMPFMDGFAFLDKFEALGDKVTGHCKVILLSSAEDFQYLNRANKNKYVRKFLNKPLTKEVLNALNI